MGGWPPACLRDATASVETVSPPYLHSYSTISRNPIPPPKTLWAVSSQLPPDSRLAANRSYGFGFNLLTLRVLRLPPGKRVVLLMHLSSPAEVWQCSQSSFHFGIRPRAGYRVPLFLVLSLLTPAYPQTLSDELTQMNIEELMNVELTSVSGHEQFLSKTAAAIFVITEEEILRSGATNIPD